MDNGILISWYDLPTAGREAYISWLNEVYIPGLLKKPGIMWAAHYTNTKLAPPPHVRHAKDESLPSGNEFVLIVGAKSTHAFSKGASAFRDGALDRLHANLSEADRKKLSMRVGERVCIMAVEARVDGPEAGRRQGMNLSPCIQLGSFNASSCDAEDELLSWYADWRMSALSALPGCVGMRKLVSTSGWAKHAVLYEFTSLESRNEHLPSLKTAYPDMAAWTEQFIPKLTHAPGSPVVGQRIWPEVE